MKRYITIETYAGDISALTEADDYKDALYSTDVADWVWQFADSADQAISQHHAKHDTWQADIDAGKPEKDTY